MEKSKRWLFESAFPFWMNQGIDAESGGIVEGVSLDGQVARGPRRLMIQGRQLYTFRVAHDMGFRGENVPEKIRQVLEQVFRLYSLPSGAFAHAVAPGGKVSDSTPDLYGQAFVLFGLANSFKVLNDPKIRERAKALLAYLNGERRAAAGGYTELSGGKEVFRSNPHMHLFEAALAWRAIDQDPAWVALSDEIYALASTKFIDEESGMLAEQFDEKWAPLRENGRFFGEPGHFYEWSWLFQWYSEVTGLNTERQAEGLFYMAEKFGVCPRRGVVYDEIWSDRTSKKTTSRYWPQCERIKAALRLGEGKVADRALEILLKYLETPVKGLCFDQQLDDGSFAQQTPRASFLYHVVNAMEEYEKYRPGLEG